MKLAHGWLALRAVAGREVYKFMRQPGRLVSSLVRPALWLVVFASGFQNVFGVAIIPPYETYVEYRVYMVPGLVMMVCLFNGMQSSLAMVYDREMGVMRLLLTEGQYPAIATHDPAMLDETRAFARERGIPSDRYEFQMLYGVRRDLQSSFTRDGHRVRVYVPFGREWFPYFMRRLGERPANVTFVIRALLRDPRE